LATDFQAAIAYAAAGEFSAAQDVCDQAGSADQPAAFVLQASMWRQLGDAYRAQHWDMRAVTSAHDLDTRLDARVGVIADAIASNDINEAQRELSACAHDIAAGSTRVQIRWSWVQAELALATQQIDAAIRHAQTAVELAKRYESLRHRCKSALILAVARGDDELAEGAYRDAHTHGWNYLAWAAATYLASLEPPSQSWLTTSAALADHIAGQLNTEQGEVWRVNPAVVAVRARVALGYV